jgi:hypothetical protein
MNIRFRDSILLVLATLLLGGCGSSGPLVSDQLDPVTGVTVTRSTVPLVLYRDHSALAAHARDFVYVGPIQVNRMGNYNHFLWLGIWSTMQDQNISEQRDGFESIVVFADGEPLRLELHGWTRSSIGVSEHVYPAPTATAANAYYAVTLDQIRLITQARDISLRTSGFRDESYEPWSDPTRALSSFREFLNQ